jgi:lysozyme
MKRWFTLTIIALLLAGIFYLLLNTGTIRFNYPNKFEYPVRGIDISHHQSSIDWEKLDNEDITFIFMKATEGGDHVDSKFNDYWNEARSRNYLVGAYHFFRYCKSGWEQAENFINNVPKDSMLPPVIDLEYGGACKKEVLGYDMEAEIQDFLNQLENHYGHKPIIYSTPEFYREFIQGKYEDYPIWMRGIIQEPELPDNRNWTFWQFANKGKIDAIDGFVDLNVYCDDINKIKKMVK